MKNIVRGDEVHGGDFRDGDHGCRSQT
jgi:hypothetical protein